MTELFKSKYQIKSTRLPSWDYSNDGYYFITICINNHKCLFGKIENNEMILNKLGKIAVKYWLEIPKYFDNLILDEFIVMPNHIHGIIEIKNNDINRGKNAIPNNNVHRDKNGRDEALPRLYKGEYPQMSKISPKPKSMPVIIGSFKSIVTKTINKQFSNVDFQWQPRFYDHIIRNEESLYNIREYIQINPEMWDRDRNNPQNMLK